MNHSKTSPQQTISRDESFERAALRITKWVGSVSSLFTHTIFFTLCFGLTLFGVAFERMLLFLTTIVSLEAIYLAILIQFTVNKNTENLIEVGKEIDEIQEDVGEIQEDIDEIQEDVGEIQEDIDEIQEDVGDIEEGEDEEEKRDKEIKLTVEEIKKALEKLSRDLEQTKRK